MYEEKKLVQQQLFCLSLNKPYRPNYLVIYPTPTKHPNYFEGAKQVFEWDIEAVLYPKEGLSRIGSWEANYWFEVKTGKTEKMTLANAKRSLRAKTKIESTFEYID